MTTLLHSTAWIAPSIADWMAVGLVSALGFAVTALFFQLGFGHAISFALAAG
jgi:hypothetical protein